MNIQKILILGFSLFGLWLASCSTSSQSMNAISYPSALSSARHQMDKKNYITAETQIQNYLNNPSDIQWHGHAYLLLGETRMLAHRSSEAVEAYKRAVKLGAGYDQRILVQGLYRISWIYERDREFNDLLIVLGDLEKNLVAKDKFIKEVETPSRLANVYYVLGQWEVASKIRAKVIERTQGEPPGPGLHYSMLYRNFAAFQPAKIPDGISPEDLLSLVQLELLEVGEMGQAPAAKLAFSSLNEHYQNLWKKLQEQKTFKAAEEQQNYNKGRLEVLAQFMDQIQALKSARRPPDLIVNSFLSAEFFNKLGVIEKEVRRLVQSLTIGVQSAKPKKSGS